MSSPLVTGIVNLLLILNQLIAIQAGQESAASGNKRTPPVSAASANQTPNNDTSGVDEILRDTFQLLDSLDEKLSQANNKTRSDNLSRELRSLDEIERDFVSQQKPAERGDSKDPTNSLVVPNLFSKINSQQHTNGNTHMQDDDRLTQMADQFSSVRKSSANSNEAYGHDRHDLMATAASSLQEKRMSNPPLSFSAQSSGERTSRQLAANEESPNGQQTNMGRFDSNFTEKHIKFTLDMMQAIFASQSQSSKSGSLDSFLISPVSIQQVLMMMHLAARGQTKRELGNTLHFLSPSPTTTMTTASNISGTLLDLGATNSSTFNKNSKLSRRNPQQKHQASAPTTTKPSANQQILNNNVHEQFGAAIRQLLMDPSVSKALASANQIFLQKDLPLSPQYEWAVKHYYGADLKQVDFQSQGEPSKFANQTANSSSTNVQQMINEWVERQTRGKLSNFLSSPVPTSTLLMALNVLFYKGDWQYKFDPAETDPDAWFTRTDGKTVKMPMMVSKLPLAHAHDQIMKTSVIELPYKAQRLGLFILLPDEVNGIFDTIQLLNSTSFANLISMMRKPAPSSAGDLHGPSGGGINVRLPKFSIDSSPRLSQILSQQLGLKTLFSPDVADLSGMFASGQSQAAAVQRRSSLMINQTSPSSEIHTQQSPAPPQVGLDELLHKAVLQVHEQGSVAAAASATIVERVGLFNGLYFEADHPFLVFLMDKQTGLVLFSGVFAGPTGSPNSELLASPKQNQALSSGGTVNNANSTAHRSEASGSNVSLRNAKVSAQ